MYLLFFSFKYHVHGLHNGLIMRVNLYKQKIVLYLGLRLFSLSGLLGINVFFFLTLHSDMFVTYPYSTVRYRTSIPCKQNVNACLTLSYVAFGLKAFTHLQHEVLEKLIISEHPSNVTTLRKIQRFMVASTRAHHWIYPEPLIRVNSLHIPYPFFKFLLSLISFDLRLSVSPCFTNQIVC
jgi:hypothetical protein